MGQPGGRQGPERQWGRRGAVWLLRQRSAVEEGGHESGDLDATTYFYYDGSEVIEERDGSDDLYQQYVWGPNHIDELAITFGANGTTFAYADANWNVIGLTTVAGDLAEEYNYTPYGRLQTWRHTSPLDADGDGDFDITDYGAVHTAYYGGQQGYNRLCDFDSDGDVDNYDYLAFMLANSEPVRRPRGRTSRASRAGRPGRSRTAGRWRRRTLGR